MRPFTGIHVCRVWAAALFDANQSGTVGPQPASHITLAQMLGWLVVAAGGIAGVCLAAHLACRWLHRHRFDSHGSLFSELCRLHDVDRTGRKLLRRVARHHKLRHPARLFTEPKWLDPGGVSGSLQRRRGELKALRKRLFC